MSNPTNDPILRYQKIAARSIGIFAVVGAALGGIAIAVFSPANAVPVIFFPTVIGALFGNAIAAMVPIENSGH
jgi:hypothetical protein